MIVLLSFIGWLGVPPPAIDEARRTDDPALTVRARATVDAAEIKLSGEVRVRLSVEGPAPLEVTRPKPLLSTTGLWRVREDGLPVREVLPGNRQEWVQDYRLSPLVPNDALPVNVAPFVVRAGPPTEVRIEFAKFLPVKVTTTAKPDAETLIPPTGIEETPEPPPTPPAPSTWWWFAAAGALAVLAVAVDQLRRRPREMAENHDAAWAERQAAEADGPDRLAAVLRRFLEYRFGQRLTARTTAELSDELGRQADCPPAAAAAVTAFLTACDAARFSGTAADVAGLRGEIRDVIRRFQSVSGPAIP